MSDRSVLPAVGRPAMVGRDRERAELRAALAEAASGRTSAVVVTGETGVGKSRLVAELVAEARGTGAVVLAGTAVGIAGSPPFGPVLSGLRALLRSPLGACPDDLLGPLAGPLDELLAVGPAGLPSRGEVLELLHRVVLRLAATAVVVLVVEDLQWVDRPTRDLLAYLVADLVDERVLLIAAHRSGRRSDASAARVLITELARNRRVRTLELAPLSRQAVAELVAASAPGRPELTELVWARSGGNAFVAEQTVRAALGGSPTAVPAVLREFALSRLVQLSAPALRAVRAVAAADGPLPHRLLEAVLDGDPEVLAALREAADAGLVVVGGASNRAAHGAAYRAAYRAAHCDSYRLCNGLLVDVVLGELLPGELMQLHRRYAVALSAGWAGEPPGGSDRLVHHWQAAGEPGPALAAAVDAALTAERSRRYADAYRYWLRAAALVDTVASGGAGASVDRVVCLDHAAECAALAGDPAAAVTVLVGAPFAGTDTRPVASAEAARRCAQVAGYLLAAGRAEEAATALDRAARPLDGSARAPHAEVLAVRAEVLCATGDLAGAQRTAGQALESAEAVRPAVRAHALAGLGFARACRDDPAAGEAALRESLAVAEREADQAGIARAHRGLAELLTGPLDEPERGVRGARAGFERLVEMGLARGAGAGLLAAAAGGLFRLGRWDEALAVVDRAWRLGPTGAEAVRVRLARARLSTARGYFDEAEDDLAAVEAATGTPGPRLRATLLVAAADLALWRLRPDLALDHVAAGLDAGPGPDDPLLLAALVGRGARARAELTRLGVRRPDGDLPDRLRRHAYDLAARAGAAVAPVRRAVLAGMLTCRAEDGRVTDRSDPQAWEQAVEEWTVLGRPYPTAYAHLRRAEALLVRRTNSAAGVTALRDAARIAGALDATPLLAEIGELAERARVRLDGGLPAPAPAPGTDEPDELVALTARELEVLGELADGRTNREIAGRLFISEKTVGVHVSRIYAKMGVHSRVQASAVLLRCRPERRRR